MHSQRSHLSSYCVWMIACCYKLLFNTLWMHYVILKTKIAAILYKDTRILQCESL